MAFNWKTDQVLESGFKSSSDAWAKVTSTYQPILQREGKTKQFGLGVRRARGHYEIYLKKK